MVECRMNQETERPPRTLTFQILWLVFILTMLPAELACAVMLKNDLISGQTYSPGVVFGLGRIVYRDATPGPYWALMGVYVTSVGTLILLCVSQLFQIASEDVRRGSSLTERWVLWGAGCAYFVLFALVCRYVYLGITG